MRKLVGIAALAALAVAVKKYLDGNPETKRQVKEQAGKAFGQAKQVASEAGEKIRTRTGESQGSTDRPLTSPGVTTPPSPTTPPVPDGSATGAPTTL